MDSLWGCVWLKEHDGQTLERVANECFDGDRNAALAFAIDLLDRGPDPQRRKDPSDPESGEACIDLGLLASRRPAASPLFKLGA